MPLDEPPVYLKFMESVSILLIAVLVGNTGVFFTLDPCMEFHVIAFALIFPVSD